MKSSYKKLAYYIRQVDERNSEDARYELLGVSVEKCFIKSIANTVGTDWRGYKKIRRGQFCYIPDTSRRGDKIGIALQNDYEIALVSQAYTVFEISDTDLLLPEYLNLWFKRPEFDRYARFHSHGSVREIFDWEEMCNVTLPIPSIEEQQKIVDAYNTIERRIAIKRQINDNLESQALAIYNTTLADTNLNEVNSIYSILTVINGSPFSSDLFNTEKKGFPLVRIRDLSTCNPDVYTDEVLKSIEYVNIGDILIGMDGEFLPHMWFGKTGVLNQRVCKVVPKEKYIHSLFLYFTLMPILSDIQRTQGGTTVIHIGKKDFDKMTCVSLSSEKHKTFTKKVAPLYNQILNNFREVFELLKMKSLILTALSR